MKFIPNKELGLLMSTVEIISIGWAEVGGANDLDMFFSSFANQSFSLQPARCCEAAPGFEFQVHL